ncbi:hypothetical protein ACIQXF_13680 [Lysinibacillus sp. NPDC097231]|uniref:hypothetical protein n=1 Tax=Lysinibacillus sp. NPDC097231 TaxID=3364142 RepID=UPI00381C3635
MAFSSFVILATKALRKRGRPKPAKTCQNLKKREKSILETVDFSRFSDVNFFILRLCLFFKGSVKE